MRYESLLASRYIRAQKRQSIFTLLSIAVAVAVLTVFFVFYGVLLGNVRAAAYQEAPYHLLIYEWPENKATALRSDKHVKSVSFEPAGDGSLAAKITFRPGLDDPKDWLNLLAHEYGAEIHREVSLPDGDGKYAQNLYEWNEMLMFVDGIDSESIVVRLFLFALFSLFALFFSLAIRLVVDSAFEVSSKEREQHYGMLQAIGATPQQIVRIITREGLRLCVLAIPIGVGLGVLLALGMYHAILSAGLSNLIRSRTGGTFQPRFLVQPRMLLISAAVGVIWTFFSAYGVGLRVVRKSTMDAITAREKTVEQSKRSGGLSRERTLLGVLSSLLFGLSGRIAYRNARRQKKRFRITVLTLTVSITLFAIFSSLATAVENIMLTRIKENAYNGSDFFITPKKNADPRDVVELLENSDLFQETRVEINKLLEYPVEDALPDELSRPLQVMMFVNPSEYRQIFGDDPAVPYETLADNAGVVYIDVAFQDEEVSAYFQKLTDAYRPLLSGGEPGTITLNSYHQPEYNPWELVADPSKEKPAIERRPHEFTLYAIVEQQPSDDYHYYGYGGCLIGTLETYLEIRDDLLSDRDNSERDYDYDVRISLFVGEENGYSRAAYQKIEALFREHSDQFEVWGDSYSMGLETQDKMAALRAGMLFLNCFIALAALVNLLNIISTGIANRRSELASLQCVGMTDGQLLRVTLIECMQYIVKAALSSAVICALIIVGFNQFLIQKVILGRYGEMFGGFQQTLDMVKLKFAAIAFKITLASAAAFAAGCAASVFMLRSQGKQSLAERIRNAE